MPPKPVGRSRARAQRVGGITPPREDAKPRGAVTPPASELAGVVLAGGYSTRMGRDKAMLRVKGQLLWRRQMAVLRAAGAEPLLIGRRAEQASLGRGALVVHDLLIDAGPIAGLHAALVATDTEWIAVLAVDLPAISAEWFQMLWKSCSTGVGAVARHADGFEPLAAIYPREALAFVARRATAKRFSLQDLIKALVRAHRMNVVPLPENERWRVRNWNRSED